MARMAVAFDPQVRSSRRLRDDERAVCRSFSRHAEKCSYCYDPVNVWRKGGQLCDRGRDYAIDLAKYIYSKGGRPHSVIDKASYGQRVEIEIPVEYEAVRELIKAFDKGLTLASRRPVVSQDRDYYVPSREQAYYGVAVPNTTSRRERHRYHDDGLSRRHTVYGGGSLYHADEEARRSRRRYEDEPIIVLAQPGRRSSRYYD
jgi:hypothetical protein